MIEQLQEIFYGKLDMQEIDKRAIITTEDEASFYDAIKTILNSCENRPSIQPTDKKYQFSINLSEIILKSKRKYEYRETRIVTKDLEMTSEMTKETILIKNSLIAYCKKHGLGFKENDSYGLIIECGTESKKMKIVNKLIELNYDHMGWSDTKISTKFQQLKKC